MIYIYFIIGIVYSLSSFAMAPALKTRVKAKSVGSMTSGSNVLKKEAWHEHHKAFRVASESRLHLRPVVDFPLASDFTPISRFEAAQIPETDPPKIKTYSLKGQTLSLSQIRKLFVSNGELSDLESLDLSQATFRPTGLEYLPTSLKSLNLSMTGLGPLDLSNLEGLEKLEVLDLSDNRLGVMGIINLSRLKLPRLISLNLSHTELGPDGARYLAKYFPNLKRLNISNNGIKNEGALAISSSLKNISTLNISGNCISNSKVVLNLLKALPNLYEVDIGWNFLNPKLLEALKEQFIFIEIFGDE